jgi:predicted RNA-binding Zn-ribbon protein involved in translation (DUF1610 family)
VKPAKLFNYRSIGSLRRLTGDSTAYHSEGFKQSLNIRLSSKVKGRIFKCPRCGMEYDRDSNACINIG